MNEVWLHILLIPSKIPFMLRVTDGVLLWCDGYVLNYYFVFTQTPVYDSATGVTKDKVSAFIVERAFGGVTRLVFGCY